MEVYDGVSNSADMLGSHTGNTLPSVIVSTGPDILVNLLSDGSVTRSGFSAQYDSSKPRFILCKYSNSKGS